MRIFSLFLLCVSLSAQAVEIETHLNVPPELAARFAAGTPFPSVDPPTITPPTRAYGKPPTPITGFFMDDTVYLNIAFNYDWNGARLFYDSQCQGIMLGWASIIAAQPYIVQLQDSDALQYAPIFCVPLEKLSYKGLSVPTGMAAQVEIKPLPSLNNCENALKPQMPSTKYSPTDALTNTQGWLDPASLTFVTVYLPGPTPYLDVTGCINEKKGFNYGGITLFLSDGTYISATGFNDNAMTIFRGQTNSYMAPFNQRIDEMHDLSVYYYEVYISQPGPLFNFSP